MEEMIKTIIFLLIISGLIASIIEVIKKIISVEEEKAGKKRLKTKLTSEVIIVIALALSILFILIAYTGGVLIGNFPIVIIYCCVVFFAQWFIDMQIVKKLAEKIIDKVINRI